MTILRQNNYHLVENNKDANLQYSKITSQQSHREQTIYTAILSQHLSTWKVDLPLKSPSWIQVQAA